MSNQEFETKRTALANAFAAAGADLLDYIGIADTAVAAIPDTQPQKYAAAGTLNGILSMAGKMMGEDGVTGLKLLPHYAIDRHGNGDVQNYFRVADVERLLAAAAVGEGVPDLHNAIKAAFIAGFKESGEGWNYEMLCDPENDPHFVARMNDYLAAAAVSQPTGDLTEIERIAAYWEDQARRGCVDAFQCALKEAWSTAIATYLARQPKAEQAEPAKVQGDANDVLALLGEADDLLFIASDAMLKMGLRDKGSDCGLPHEVRRFALEFSNEGRDGPGALQVRGTGRYRAWLTAARKIDCAAPASQEGAHLARQAQAEGAAPTVAQAAGRSAGDILSKLESRLSWMLDDDQYKNIQAMLLAVRGQLGAEGVASIAPPANVESFVTEAGFWVRREERVDKTHGWLLCDATDRIICALTPAERDLVDGAIAACQAPAPAEAKSATSIAPASPAGAQNAEAIRNQAESISAADQNTEWSYDLQTRLIAASQDLAQDDDARQVMAEAACLLAALTGSANTQEGGAE